jgi:signal transduction histidine kinase
VLLLGRVEAGRMKFVPEEMDLCSFCRQLTDEMASATRGRCPIRLHCEPTQFPPAQGDETVLRHILGNLLSNAAKYSKPNTTVEFTVRRSNANAVFKVQDFGIGIPASEGGKLFEAFQRASNAAPYHGTGLGLTIVKRCVDLHGGQVSFTSEEGRGTTFTVIIPMFEETLSAAKSPSEIGSHL